MLSRRNFLLASAGAVAARPLAARAQAMPVEKPTVVCIFFSGSYNAIFSGADAYVPGGFFSVTADNVRDVGNGVVVDRGTIGSLPDEVLAKMATVGVAHGYSDHISGPRQFFMNGIKSYPLQLAKALGGQTPFRAVRFGLPLPGVHKALDGVSMTSVPDLSAAIALAGTGGSGETPRPNLMARALRSSLKTSEKRFAQSPNSLATVWNGMHTLIGALEHPPATLVDWNELSAAYGIPATDTSAQSFRAHMAGAELMIRAGVDVVCVKTDSWDHHGDGTALTTRDRVSTELMPGLSAFLSRTLAMPDRNVVTVLFGEFARTGGVGGADSGHANGTSATVFGRYVKQGTTGRPIVRSINLGSASYALPMDTPKTPGFWAYLAAAAKSPEMPFGPNPHTSLLL